MWQSVNQQNKITWSCWFAPSRVVMPVTFTVFILFLLWPLPWCFFLLSFFLSLITSIYRIYMHHYHHSTLMARNGSQGDWFETRRMRVGKFFFLAFFLKSPLLILIDYACYDTGVNNGWRHEEQGKGYNRLETSVSRALRGTVFYIFFFIILIILLMFLTGR